MTKIHDLLTFSPAASKRKCTVFNGESFRRAVVGVRTRTHQGMGDRPIDGHGLNEGGLITRDRKSGSSRCCRRLGRRTSILRTCNGVHADEVFTEMIIVGGDNTGTGKI